MAKEKRTILKKCSYYRGAENLSPGGSDYCKIDNQPECTGDIQFCENTEVLNKYVSERGLGWQKNKGRNIFKRIQQVIGRLASARWR